MEAVPVRRHREVLGRRRTDQGTCTGEDGDAKQQQGHRVLMVQNVGVEWDTEGRHRDDERGASPWAAPGEGMERNR